MSTGLLNQLEAYFTDVDTGQGPVSPDRVAGLIDQVRELPTSVPVRNRAPVWIAVAAFAVVLILGGVLALIAPFGGDSVAPADQPAPTVPPTTPSPTTGVPDADALRGESAGPIVWSNPVDDYPFARVYELPDGGFLTVSAIGEGSDLYSSDGRAWVDAADTASFYAEHHVVWVQGNWAVVVGVGEDRDTAEYSLAHYRDGSWRLVANVDSAETDWEGMASFEGTSVFMEHGSDADVVWIGDDLTGVVRETAAPWPVSDVADGWRKVPVLTVDGVGFFAYPLDFFNDGTENGVFGTTDTAGIWASADGVTWERHSDNPFAPPGVSHLQMDTVGTTLWATVHTGGTAALPKDYFAYWSSIDGVTWAVEGEAVNGQADVLEQELFAEPILIRAGLVRRFGYDFETSSDGGVTWTAVPGPPVECHGRMGEPAIGVVGDFLYCGGFDGFWVGHFEGS